MTIQNIKPINGVNLQGKILVHRGDNFNPEFSADKFRLWKAEDGFGCNPRLTGQAIVATCLADGEVARLERGDFVGWVEQADADAVLNAEDTQ
jgi:hypothetical protein